MSFYQAANIGLLVLSGALIIWATSKKERNPYVFILIGIFLIGLAVSFNLIAASGFRFLGSAGLNCLNADVLLLDVGLGCAVHLVAVGYAAIVLAIGLFIRRVCRRRFRSSEEEH